MKNEKPPEDNFIAIFVPGLPDTPGWLKLSRKKQDELLKITSDHQQSQKVKWLGEFGELMSLYRAEKILDGEEMNIKDYVRLLYPDRHDRTIDRKMEKFREFISAVPIKVMDRLSIADAATRQRFDRIANAALGDIRNAVKEMPQLTTGSDKDAEKYLEALDTKLLEHRQMKRKGKSLSQDEQFAAKMSTNAVLHYIRACGLKTSAEKRKFLTRVMGWVMEAQAVSGTLRAGRIQIPDGILIRRGRPRKNPAKKAV